MNIVTLTEELGKDLGRLRFSPPVAYVYNPLTYAREPCFEYLRRYGSGRKEVLFVGMNPGPWGMAQTGVPFGEVCMVRDWLGIAGKVGRPEREHPRRPVDGFGCKRSEVSGRRLWGLFRDRFGSPEHFFARFFVLNYCPLLFLDKEGRNITPEKLRGGERDALLTVCDRALHRAVECLQPTRVIGIGSFAARQALRALADTAVQVGKIHHPSPANPAANRNWQEIVLAELESLDVKI
ncbi:MAG TPA: uracil-DNA glycosylase family protein [Geobacteraceae bacterium]